MRNSAGVNGPVFRTSKVSIINIQAPEKFPGILPSLVSQPDGVSRIKSVRWTVNRLPPGSPFAVITFKWRSIESQPGNHGEGVTLARINRDPSASAPLAVTSELRRTHRRGDQTSGAQHIGNCAGTIVSVIIKRFVTTSITIALVAKLVAGPNRPLHREGRILRRSRFPESKTGDITGYNRSRGREKIRRGGWNDDCQNRDDR